MQDEWAHDTKLIDGVMELTNGDDISGTRRAGGEQHYNVDNLEGKDKRG